MPGGPGAPCWPASLLRRGRGPLLSGQSSPERPPNLGSPACTTCAGEGGRQKDLSALSELQESKTRWQQQARTRLPRQPPLTPQSPGLAPRASSAHGLSHEPRSLPNKRHILRARPVGTAEQAKHSWPVRNSAAPPLPGPRPLWPLANTGKVQQPGSCVEGPTTSGP